MRKPPLTAVAAVLAVISLSVAIAAWPSQPASVPQGLNARVMDDSVSPSFVTTLPVTIESSTAASVTKTSTTPAPSTTTPASTTVSRPSTSAAPTTSPVTSSVNETSASTEPAVDVQGLGRVDLPWASVTVDAATVVDGVLHPSDQIGSLSQWLGGPGVGESGTILLTSHVGLSGQPGVLARLGDTKIGAGITTHAPDGSIREWQITDVVQVPKTGLPPAVLRGHDGPDRLVLASCGGVFDSESGHHVDNIIVYAIPRT